MIKLLKISLILILVIITGVVKSQDPAFSQFYAAPLFLNPSLAGGEYNLRANISYRTNMNKQLMPYSLAQFSLIKPIRLKTRLLTGKISSNENYVGGVGFTVYNEAMGHNNELIVSGLSGTVSYFTQLSLSNFISFGTQIGIIQKLLDFSKLTWGTQYDPEIGFNSNLIPSISNKNEKNIIPVINAGVTWYYNIEEFSQIERRKFRSFVGVAASNLNQPDGSFYDIKIDKIPILFKLNGGFAFRISKNFEILPNYLLMMQNKNYNINIGTYIAYYISGNTDKNSNFYQIQFGSWFRYKDSYIISFGLEMNTLVLGFSYDYNISGFKYNNQGVNAVEISLSYKVRHKKTVQQRNISHPII